MKAASKQTYISKKALYAISQAKEKLKEKEKQKQMVATLNDSSDLSDEEYQKRNLSC